MAVMFCIAKVWERNGGIVKTKNKSMNQAFSVTKNGMNPAYGISLIFPQLAIVTVGHSKMPERPHWKANIHTALGCPRQSWTLFLLLHQHKEAPVWTCNDSQCDLLIRVHGNYFFFFNHSSPFQRHLLLFSRPFLPYMFKLYPAWSLDSPLVSALCEAGPAPPMHVSDFSGLSLHI